MIFIHVDSQMFLASHAVQSLIHNILLFLTSSNKARRFPKITEIFSWYTSFSVRLRWTKHIDFRKYRKCSTGSQKQPHMFWRLTEIAKDVWWLHEFVRWILLTCIKDKSAVAWRSSAYYDIELFISYPLSLCHNVTEFSTPSLPLKKEGGEGGKLGKRWLTSQRMQTRRLLICYKTFSLTARVRLAHELIMFETELEVLLWTHRTLMEASLHHLFCFPGIFRPPKSITS